MRRVVVLPAPFGPRKPRISPSRTVRSIPRTASLAVLRELREELEAVSPRVGLMPRYAASRRVIEDAPALRSRLWASGQEVQANLEQALREETGAADDDPMPHLIAGQLGWV